MSEQLQIFNTKVADYCEKFRIEEVLNRAINEVFLKLPPDPFSSICSTVKQYCLNNYIINSVTIKNEINSDFENVVTLKVKMSYKGNSRDVFSFPIPYNFSDYEKIKENPNQIIEIFNNHFEKDLEKMSVETIDEVDAFLAKKYLSLPQEAKLIGKIIINSLSISLFMSMSLMCEQTLPQYIRDKTPEFMVKASIIPSLGFSIFKTGKTMNSKVKFERFMIMIQNKNKMDTTMLVDVVNKIYASLRKALTSGKQGENGMRLNNEGSFYPPSDNLNDILKLLETIIAEVNIPDILKIGIDCNANNYYNASDKTYEMDGFKKPPDTDQLIEFYNKLIADHPLIEYMEEPFSKTDEEGLYKFIIKSKAEGKKTVIVSKSSGGTKSGDANAIPTEPLAKKRGDLVLDTLSNAIAEQKCETDEPKKEEEEDNEKANYLSFRVGEVFTCSDIFKNISTITGEGEDEEEPDYGIFLWDCDVESKQTCIVDLGLGIRASCIFLNGITLKEEKMGKIKKYIEEVQELY